MPRLNMPSRILGPAHVLRACAVLLCLAVLACSSGGGDESDSSATSSAGGGQGAGASSSDDGTLPLGAAWLPQTIGSFVPGNSAITGMTTTDGAAWVLGKRFNVPVVWRSTDGVSWTETEVAPSGEGVLTIEDIVDLPSGGLLGGGGLYTDCVEYDAPAGYRVLQLCRQSRPVFYRSDDDGASWRTIVPDAMASTVDTPNYYRDLAVHGDEVVAVTTVKGEDWRARVWSSSDGEQWTLASELRGVDYPMSVDQVISDGDAIVVAPTILPASERFRILVYFGGQRLLNNLASLLGLGPVSLSPFWAGVVAIAFIYGAYLTETFRGAYQTIPQGQVEAAQALGLRGFALHWNVTIPQLIRFALPGYANVWQVLVKSTAVVSVIGLEDLVGIANEAGKTAREPFIFYMAVLAVYLFITWISTTLFEAMERRYAAPLAHAR